MADAPASHDKHVGNIMVATAGAGAPGVILTAVNFDEDVGPERAATGTRGKAGEMNDVRGVTLAMMPAQARAVAAALLKAAGEADRGTGRTFREQD